MKLTFFGSVLGYHQEALVCEFYNQLKEDFRFVAYQGLPEMRVKLGFEELNEKYSFVVRAYEEDGRLQAKELIQKSDIAIVGAAPSYVIEECIKNKIHTFLYSERFFKNGTWRRFVPSTYKHLFDRVIKFSGNKYFHVLCASAYLPIDLKMLKVETDTYKWGYFPKFIPYDIQQLMQHKSNKEEPVKILWAARFIGCKHPEKALEVATRLKRDGYSFCFTMIGGGKLYVKVEKEIIKRGLEKEVKLAGIVPPEQVREEMVKSDIFLFTSDKKEGWGVVLNEAMNSGCAIVASYEAGSVPFVSKKGENMLIYYHNSTEELYCHVKKLIEEAKLRRYLAKNAYDTLEKTWNPSNAAKRAIEIGDNIRNNKSIQIQTGRCSHAEILI